MLMPDSRLNGAERDVQQSFMKSPIFNGLLVFSICLAAYLPIKALPDLPLRPPADRPLNFRQVQLPPTRTPLRLAGAWEVDADDPRFGGLSGLAIDRGRFLAVSDLGAAIRFDRPGAQGARVQLSDLRDGPAAFGEKWARDAESLAPDPARRGWWVAFEQNHSLWLFDRDFGRALASIDLRRDDWWNNRGAEGLIAEGDQLLVVAENGRDAMRARKGELVRLALDAGADVADAARAPDGSSWILLRSKGPGGIAQSIAPLIRSGGGYRAGPAWPLPKGAFDNYEGMAIEALPAGGLRFWLVTDDGHRIMARTLLVALDHVPSARQRKSPALGAGLSKEPAVKTP